MAGFLLARAGVDVIVLEKHADFLRDFRGDTIHPSTLHIMDELGLLDEFLRLPHHKAYALSAWIGERQYKVADFSSLPGKGNFIAFMPQWDFLDFIAAHARALTNFRLLMNTAGERLLFDGDRVCGLSATGPDGELTTTEIAEHITHILMHGIRSRPAEGAARPTTSEREFDSAS
jgi:2-polyprenyl-6-methoxyphenol hydroxylase-like FAD-dependent oxidoreductase